MSQPSEMFSDGQAYEKLMGRWSRLVGDQFITWIDAPEEKSWLDVGCGTGAFTEEIIAKCRPALVTGVDPSPAQIEFAQARPKLSAAQLQVADAVNLPFEDHTFDVGVMALVIAFIPDAMKAVSELARVTASGGLVATYMWDFPDRVPGSPIYRAFVKLGRPAPMPPNPEASKAAALESMWKNAGLKNVETTTFQIEVSFDDFNDYWHTVTLPVGPQGKMIQGLPEEFRAALKAELHAQLSTRADGRIVYGCSANAVRGYKA